MIMIMTIIWVLISLVWIMSIGEEADVDVVANDLPFQWLPWLLSLGGKTPPGRRGSTRETAL